MKLRASLVSLVLLAVFVFAASATAANRYASPGTPGAKGGLTPGAAFAEFARENPGASDGRAWIREDLYKARLEKVSWPTR